MNLSYPNRLTDAQQAEAFAVVREFGPRFAGIHDRLDDASYKSNHPEWYDASVVAEAVAELLDSVAPAVCARILAA